MHQHNNVARIVQASVWSSSAEPLPHAKLTSRLTNSFISFIKFYSLPVEMIFFSPLFAVDYFY